MNGGEIICFSRKKVVLFTSSLYISNGTEGSLFLRPMPLQIFTYSSRQPSVNFLSTPVVLSMISPKMRERESSDVHFADGGERWKILFQLDFILNAFLRLFDDDTIKGGSEEGNLGFV